MRDAARQLKLALVRRGKLAGLLLVALLCAPAVSFAQVCPKTVTANFDGACHSDVLWQNTGSGQVDIWFMNGTGTSSAASPGNPGPGWVIQGVGDFDGNGTADILWQNSTTGQIVMWLMNGSMISNAVNLPAPGLNWSVQGVGDFDGNGTADILWLDSNTGNVVVWLMNGTGITGAGLVGTPGLNWTVQGIGDFDGNGTADILWRDSITGNLVIWLMSGTVISGSGSPASAISSDWSIQGIGDFDGDFKSDILWRQGTTGAVVVWFMNGTSINGSGSPGTPPGDSSLTCGDTSCSGNGWSIQGVGDFDGDGHSDILWRQVTSSGQVAIWLMNSTTITGSGSPGTPTNDWQIALLAPYGCPNADLCGLLSAANNWRANGPFGTGNPAPSETPGGPLQPFTWDVGAATVALNWSAQCMAAHDPNVLNYTYTYGENINFGVPQTGPGSVAGWGGENANFTYPDTCAQGTCGHYTQLVWRTSTSIGCGHTFCTVNSPFPPYDWDMYVCDFVAPGNYPAAPY